jgi:hypothetical protein
MPRSTRAMHHGYSVRLAGGPADGGVIENSKGGSVLVHSDEEAGKVARYRPTRDKGVLRFREWDRVVASIPAPESDHGV